MSLTVIESSKLFSGDVIYYQHFSNTCQAKMTFAVFLPEIARHQAVPAIYFLSGLTCNHENFITKSGAAYFADKAGVALIMPDTSPRDVEIDFKDMSYDLGFGAGFYVNATQAPFSEHFNMYDYVVNELPALCDAQLPILSDRIAIMGHSMGGYGALMIALKNPGCYQSVSAFAPICAPSDCPWGQKAFTHYLGPDKNEWAQYDTCELILKGVSKQALFVDQGMSDPFLKTELHLDKLQRVCDARKHPLTVKRREGYNHGYYYIASFIEAHVTYHASFLKV